MAVFNEPTKWAQTLGKDADVTNIPDTAGETDPSIDKIFPSVFSIPLARGGRAIPRSVLNGLFKLLGDNIFYLQQGGVFSYSDTANYGRGAFVKYNNELYLCIQDNSSLNKHAPTDAEYWLRVALNNDLANYLPLAGGNLTGNLTVQNKNVVRSVNGVNADAQGNVQTGFPSSSIIYIANDIANSAWSPDESWLTKYQVPANGFVTFRAQIPNNQGLSHIYVGTEFICSYIYLPNTVEVNNLGSGCWIGNTIPVAKNQIVTLSFNNLNHFFAQFIYAVGEI